MGTITVQAPTGPVQVRAYVVAGADGFVVTRAVRGSGYVVTHADSGLRLPGEPFGKLATARAAALEFVRRVPDAAECSHRIATVGVDRATTRRMADAWRDILRNAGDPITLALDAAQATRLGDVVADVLPDGWTGDEDTLTCPCGHVIEHDGTCPSGHVSPLRAMGVI